MKQKAFDCDYTDEIKCPYCGYEDIDSWEMTEEEQDDFECANCEKVFNVVRHLTIQYSSKPKEADIRTQRTI